MTYYKKYQKYKQKYVNLKLSMKGGMSLINEAELKYRALIVRSGGGDIYRVYYNDELYTYKKITPSLLKDTISNLETLDTQFRSMSRFPNLIVPLHLVKEGDIVVGYLMRFLSDYQTLGKIVHRLDINRFMKILNKICDGFLNMYSCGVTPCPEHSENIMVNDENDVVFIDLDDIIKCAGNNQQTTLAQLNIIFINLPYGLRQNVNFRKMFDINIESGDIRLKLEFETVAQLKEKIARVAADMRISL